MDLGVGYFVFSQGVVSAMQLIEYPAYLTRTQSLNNLSLVLTVFFL